MALCKRLTFLIIILLISFACGHKKSPTGGKKDLVKPEIINVFPEEFSNINNVQKLEFTFSKPIERNTIFSGLHIYPAILKIKYKWDKNTLIIIILEDLEPNKNYYFSFSPIITGEHNNSLNKDYIFVYHTGTLNKNRISGTIEYEIPEDSNRLINLNLFTADTTWIYSCKLSGSNYILENLNHQKHLIRAFIDLDNDNIYDFSDEPYFESMTEGEKSVNLTIMLAYQDTIRPRIIDAEVGSSNQIKLEFSENLSRIDRVYIEKADSLKENVEIKAWYHDRETLTVVSSDLEEEKYNIFVTELTDLKSNITFLDSILIDGTSHPDSLAPVVISHKPRNGATIDTLEPEIELVFSEIIFKENISVSLNGVEDNQTIDLITTTENGPIFHYYTKQKLKNYISYRLEVIVTDINGNEMTEPFSIIFIPVVR